MLEHEGGDAEIVHEFGRLHAFADEAELPMAAARDDDHGGAVGLVLGRGEDGDGGVVDVGDRASLDDFGFVAAGFKTGRALFPKMNDQRIVGAGGDDADETEGEEEEGSMGFHGGKEMNYGSRRSESIFDGLRLDDRGWTEQLKGCDSRCRPRPSSSCSSSGARGGGSLLLAVSPSGLRGRGRRARTISAEALAT